MWKVHCDQCGKSVFTETWKGNKWWGVTPPYDTHAEKEDYDFCSVFCALAYLERIAKETPTKVG